MGISTTRIAYKIGFSSALNEDTISAYAEMQKWAFVGDAYCVYKLQKAFGRGYYTGTKILMELKYELKMEAQNA